MVNAAHPENSADGSPGAQRLGEFLIGFDCGQARHRGSQPVRSKAGARTGLEDMRPKLGAGEHPLHPPFQRPFPTGRATEPVMQLIQAFSLCKNSCDTLRLAIAPVARFRYCDNECRKNDKSRYSTGWRIKTRALSRILTTTPPGTTSHCIFTIAISWSTRPVAL